jgi:hypothetical protein
MSSPSILSSKYNDMKIITFYQSPPLAPNSERRATIVGSNGKSFQVGDVVALSDFEVPSVYRDWRSVDGSYLIGGITVGNGLYVTPYNGHIQWSVGAATSTNIFSVFAAGGGSRAPTVRSSNGVVVDLSSGRWAVTFELVSSVTLVPNVSYPTPVLVSDPPPRHDAPGPVTPNTPVPDNGNNLSTPAGSFDIDKFIASASFKPGSNTRANSLAVSHFRSDARRAAKQARLTTDQTNKLMNAVEKAIADGIARAGKKPLDKIKKI